MKIRRGSWPLASTLVLLPCLAIAHPGREEAADVAHGVSHALSGIDHWALAMALGFWLASRWHKRQAWISVVIIVGVGVVFIVGHRATLARNEAIASIALAMALQILMGALAGRAFDQWRQSDWLMRRDRAR